MEQTRLDAGQSYLRGYEDRVFCWTVSAAEVLPEVKDAMRTALTWVLAAWEVWPRPPILARDVSRGEWDVRDPASRDWLDHMCVVMEAVRSALEAQALPPAEEHWKYRALTAERLLEVERLHAEMQHDLAQDGGNWPVYTGPGK